MPIQELLDIMSRLRDPDRGCPWDRQQSFATIAPYTIEEAYEVADAIARGDRTALCGELGDLLFQVAFHAQMAREEGSFTFEDVVQSICQKMCRRHPHVFADERIETAEQQARAWDEHKARERVATAPDASVLDDVPMALPALTRAVRIGKRAASVGFDWPGWQGARAKVAEELRELDREIDTGDRQRIEQELGDVLLAVANLARHLGVDPEAALQASNHRFVERFLQMETRAAARGKRLGDLDERALDELWREAKTSSHSG